MEKLYRELCDEIESPRRQAEAARKRESAAALAEVRRLIAEYRLSLAECGFASPSSPKVARTRDRQDQMPAPGELITDLDRAENRGNGSQRWKRKGVGERISSFMIEVSNNVAGP